MWLRKIQFIVYGMSNFTKSGFEKSAEFLQEKIEGYDLKGRYYMVTGSNSGLGFCTAKFLASCGANVYMVCRNKERGEKAVEEIISETKNENVKLIVCDVSIKKQIKEMANSFIENNEKLDVLVNNAGVMLQKRSETEEGIETTLATNSISSYLLTKLMIPVIEKSEDPRVIFVFSGGGMTEKLLFDKEYDADLQGDKYDGVATYARTKRHQIVMNEIFARDYKDTKIKFLCCHPGWSETPGVKEAMPDFYEKLKGKFRTTEQGADVINWLCVSKELKPEYSGEWFRDRQLEKKHFFLGGTSTGEKEEQNFWSWLKRISDDN